MAKAKKTAKEGSELFHNIIKASVSNSQHSGSPTICPQCGKHATFIPPAKKINDDEVESTFKCPSGHIYTKDLPIK